MNNDSIKRFGRRFSQAFADSSMDRAEAIKALRVPASRFDKLLDGKAEPTVDELLDINFHFNVSVDFLLGLTEIPDTKPSFLPSTSKEMKAPFPGYSPEFHQAMDLLVKVDADQLPVIIRMLESFVSHKSE